MPIKWISYLKQFLYCVLFFSITWYQSYTIILNQRSIIISLRAWLFLSEDLYRTLSNIPENNNKTWLFTTWLEQKECGVVNRLINFTGSGTNNLCCCSTYIFCNSDVPIPIRSLGIDNFNIPKQISFEKYWILQYQGLIINYVWHDTINGK